MDCLKESLLAPVLDLTWDPMVSAQESAQESAQVLDFLSFETVQ